MVDIEDAGGWALHHTCLLLPMFWIMYSVVTIVVSGVYSYIYLPWSDRALVHSWSLLWLMWGFWTIYYIMSYVMPLARMIIASAFIVLSIHVYDFLWSMFSQISRGGGFSWGALVAIFLVIVLLERLDNKHGFLYFSPSQSIPVVGIFVILLISFAMLSISGFFQAMTLYEQGLGPDPNICSLFWLIRKPLAVFLFLPLIKHRSDVKAPLRLDPRVLMW